MEVAIPTNDMLAIHCIVLMPPALVTRIVAINVVAKGRVQPDVHDIPSCRSSPKAC